MRLHFGSDADSGYLTQMIQTNGSFSLHYLVCLNSNPFFNCEVVQANSGNAEK
jgi:hypothetical protein